MRLLVEGARDYALVLLDREGNVASWNAGAQRLFGYSSESILCRPLKHLLPARRSKGGFSKTTTDDSFERGPARGTRVEGSGRRLPLLGGRCAHATFEERLGCGCHPCRLIACALLQ